MLPSFSASFRGRMSVIATSFSRILKPTIMNASIKLIRLEEKLTRTEVTVQKLLKDIESMKADLATLKNVRDGHDAVRPTSEPQRRSFTTDTSSINLTTDNTEREAKRTKYSFEKNGEYVIVYTDGACTSNGQKKAKAGIGVWFGDNHPLNVSKACDGRQTNNTAEIKAAAEACRVALAHGVDKLEINTDSKFLIDCITKWMPNWKRNSWKTSAGKDVINKEDLLEYEGSASQLKHVKLNHVKGHAGIQGNEGADKLAVQGTHK